ncbi:N-acetylmuramic acid 6-phosphate etherase [Facklamia miroungae]|uniref:N-acetylmuramic acid 6-phosphate etherase n=1 Tax=Facklamia miroungae TaxID=120956 RepID=A0A1G7QPV6_9LACT|nr:N-acetylmuramic acid 6-phosphate etherase [Facklamia miroungae]NKZ29024.1 N-acetylmuramic acid 6-phosphate etherase [Facklamia miroungae]SDG00566.1 N-acetylmuramic acid 6-phosphate etherase [Facklamia miroungae]
MDLDRLSTETRNKNTLNLDQMETLEIIQKMNQEDRKISLAIENQLPKIAEVIHAVVESFNRGGRLIYFGAGTSGRLGVLDAAECVPTFGVSPEMVVGLIAGGDKAMLKAVEGAEDSKDLAKEELKSINLNEKDTVVGIAASGRTPYVIGGLEYARQVGAYRATLACNKEAEISNYSQTAIEIVVGPEILTGSTRLKAGTAQKLVLNMISTAAMVGIGKVYQNLMVDVQPTNQKLIERAKRIIMQATDVDYETAEKFFNLADYDVKTAIVMILTESDKEKAKDLLKNNDGFVRQAIIKEEK